MAVIEYFCDCIVFVVFLLSTRYVSFGYSSALPQQYTQTPNCVAQVTHPVQAVARLRHKGSLFEHGFLGWYCAVPLARLSLQVTACFLFVATFTVPMVNFPMRVSIHYMLFGETNASEPQVRLGLPHPLLSR